eukprot:964486-Pyramimonas_sp.AAC.1
MGPPMCRSRLRWRRVGFFLGVATSLVVGALSVGGYLTTTGAPRVGAAAGAAAGAAIPTRSAGPAVLRAVCAKRTSAPALTISTANARA